MREFFPVIAVGAPLGVLSLIFIVAYMTIIKQKEAIDIICKEEYLTLFFLRGEAV